MSAALRLPLLLTCLAVAACSPLTRPAPAPDTGPKTTLHLHQSFAQAVPALETMARRCYDASTNTTGSTVLLRGKESGSRATLEITEAIGSRRAWMMIEISSTGNGIDLTYSVNPFSALSRRNWSPVLEEWASGLAVRCMPTMEG